MSMPEFPEGGLAITDDQAFNMLLTSIAMEELALSHIMNAEGEKLQYVLGTIPGSSGTCATTDEVIQVNKSITKLLEAVAQNQMLLKNKLDDVLEAKQARYAHREKEYMKLCANHKVGGWKKGCNFSWECNIKCGEQLIWKEEAPGTVFLPKDSLCVLDYYFQICPKSKASICVKLIIQGECESATARILEGCGRILEGSVVLPVSKCQIMPVSFQLLSPEKVCVEKAVLSIVKIA